MEQDDFEYYAVKKFRKIYLEVEVVIRDDVSKLYNNDTKLKEIIDYVFYLNIILSFISLKYSNEWILTLQILVVFINVILIFLSDYITFPQAQRERMKTNLSNALDVRLTEYETQGYYNNSMKYSEKKLILNTFESVFFTKNIIDKMVSRSFIKSVLAIIVMVITFMVFNKDKLILIVFQTVFSSKYLVGFCKLILFKNGLQSAFDFFLNKLVSEQVEKSKKELSKNELIILLSKCAEYEILKATFKIMPSTKIYKKNNDSWSQKWNDIEKKIICKEIV